MEKYAPVLLDVVQKPGFMAGFFTSQGLLGRFLIPLFSILDK
ncbi:hypothetical protein VCHC70A1_0721 [Vibrio cholerae HC-70A1]|uniref:Uncharacterized protein n=2 Tax=Vibrio cholerae TaxID=666 RepID=Q9KUE9_VIBCH|nr:hypothetical protein VC_0572 [Vibrio cholerae O1 biovar El Tor str. N16961]ACP04855.1 conserved hypothetical protein [Vibrio cholerae M66-2]ACP08608.1 conserved hypothetical protein [Vibrio cholerae O395]AET28404.1 conserved hypothetical protein [Vibrio cholerae O1 str. 2010EL-1786]EGR02253.1 hypothetical protein VCHE39_0912 [Vibrio cholerae HE39]EGR09248.1 hypothetical protein VCHE48_1625 [Vibrio cholerae HE48]EGS50620.1 hypothetical protein VCHC70A1_0721 [Vibrio cholerae HC-70A1]EGS6511